MGVRPEDIDDEPEFMAKHADCQLDTQAVSYTHLACQILDIHRGDKMDYLVSMSTHQAGHQREHLRPEGAGARACEQRL